MTKCDVLSILGKIIPYSIQKFIFIQNFTDTRLNLLLFLGKFEVHVQMTLVSRTYICHLNFSKILDISRFDDIIAANLPFSYATL